MFRITIVVISITLLLGGAGDDYRLIGAAVQLAQLLLLGSMALRPSPLRRGPLTFGGWAIACAALALPLAQLIPLPAIIWSGAPGRHVADAVLGAIGELPEWRTLSLDPQHTLEAWVEMLPGLAMFAVAARLDRHRQRTLLTLVVLAAALSAGLGAFQRSAGTAHIFAAGHELQGTGLFVNRNHQATMMLVAILLCPVTIPALAPSLRGAARGALVAAAILLFAGGVLITTSRAGLLLLAPALGCAAILTLEVRLRLVPLLSGTLLFALGVWAAWRLPVVDLVVARFAGGDERALYWQDSWPAIRAFWPWGSGIGTFTRVFPIYERDTLIGSSQINAAHNDYVQLLLEGGLPALLLIVVGIGLFGWAAIRLFGAGSRDARMGGAAGAAILMILPHSIGDYPLRMMSLMAVLGVLAAVLLTAADRLPGRSEVET